MLRRHTKNRKEIPIEEVCPSPEDNKKETVPAEEPSVTGENVAGKVSPEGEKGESANTEEKLAEMTDRYLRLMAEYDNFRKRTIREKEDIIRTATEELMKSLLPILDNLDRATEHRNSQQSLEEYAKGVTLIEDHLRATLSKAGLEQMDVVGTPFDPEKHDAIMQMESKDHEAGTVINVVEKGYVLSGKVIRHPKVIVSR